MNPPQRPAHFVVSAQRYSLWRLSSLRPDGDHGRADAFRFKGEEVLAQKLRTLERNQKMESKATQQPVVVLARQVATCPIPVCQYVATSLGVATANS